MKAICQKFQSCCNIRFETEEAGLLSPDISINMAYWAGQGRTHCLEVKVPNQKGPELVFEYRLEPTYGEPWTIRYVEELCAIHRSVWKVPGQRFTLS